jgi:hypothetical protein
MKLITVLVAVITAVGVATASFISRTSTSAGVVTLEDTYVGEGFLDLGWTNKLPIFGEGEVIATVSIDKYLDWILEDFHVITNETKPTADAQWMPTLQTQATTAPPARKQRFGHMVIALTMCARLQPSSFDFGPGYDPNECERRTFHGDRTEWAFWYRAGEATGHFELRLLIFSEEDRTLLANRSMPIEVMSQDAYEARLAAKPVPGLSILGLVALATLMVTLAAHRRGRR